MNGKKKKIFLCILCIVEYVPPSGRKATQYSPLRKILSDGCTFFLSMYVYVSMHARSLLPKVLSSNLCLHTCSRSVTQSDILSRPPGPLGAFHPSFAADCLLNQMKAMQNVTECKVRYGVWLYRQIDRFLHVFPVLCVALWFGLMRAVLQRTVTL